MGRRRGSSAFPVARIKKMMQSDDDVGKIATATPVLVAKALECMMEDVLKDAATIAIERRTKTVTPQHLKQSVCTNDQFDFLRTILASVPALDNEPASTARKSKRPRSPNIIAKRTDNNNVTNVQLASNAQTGKRQRSTANAVVSTHQNVVQEHHHAYTSQDAHQPVVQQQASHVPVTDAQPENNLPQMSTVHTSINPMQQQHTNDEDYDEDYDGNDDEHDLDGVSNVKSYGKAQLQPIESDIAEQVTEGESMHNGVSTAPEAANDDNLEVDPLAERTHCEPQHVPMVSEHDEHNASERVSVHALLS